jgi:hypothetical protein
LAGSDDLNHRYGDGVENSGQLKFNLTEQKCNVNEVGRLRTDGVA